MTFDYFEFAPNIFRPVIPIILRSPTKFMLYAALIDSGADYCIFNMDIADLLEIKLNRKNRARFMGVGKSKISGYWSKVSIRIGDVIYETKVIFAEISDFGHGILGQQGFFDHFDISLSYNDQSIGIEPVRLKN